MSTIIENELGSQKSLVEALMIVAEGWAHMRSKDPKTKVGALVYDWGTGSMHLGYNGFPKNIPDKLAWWFETPDTEFSKHDLVIHAESNAVRKALQAGANLLNCELFVTHLPCIRCAVEHIVQVGLKTVTYKYRGPAEKDLRRIKQVFELAGIKLYNLQERVKIETESK